MSEAYMPLDKLVDAGIIQESNRRFFHSLGLELVAAVQPDGALALRVRDQRDVEGGLIFEHSQPDWSSVRCERAQAIEATLLKRIAARVARYGFEVQPIQDL